MPQLDPSTFPSQIFWLIILFTTLYWLLSRKALPRVSEILEARQDRIASDLDQAQSLRAEAEEALRSYEDQIAGAREEAHRLVAETQAQLQAEAAERQADLDARLARQLTEAERRIASAREEALTELEEVAVATAQAAAERLAGLKVSRNAAQAALREIRGEGA
jgi:F-type H+-transporting ATPase subunit b